MLEQCKKRVNLVDRENICKMSLSLQNSALIQPRADLPKFFVTHQSTPTPCTYHLLHTPPPPSPGQRNNLDCVEIRLLLNLAAPVPRRGQAAVNARAAVVARAVEAVPEEVAQDRKLGCSRGAERLFDVPSWSLF